MAYGGLALLPYLLLVAAWAAAWNTDRGIAGRRLPAAPASDPRGAGRMRLPA